MVLVTVDIFKSGVSFGSNPSIFDHPCTGFSLDHKY